MKELIPFLSLLVSVMSLGVWLLTYKRAGDWKHGEDGKALIARLDSVEGRVTRAEVRLEHVATKADIAGVRAEIRSLESQIERVGAGVSRIEGHFITRGAA